MSKEMSFDELIDRVTDYNGISKNSRDVRKGFIFVSEEIERTRRNAFLLEALKAGASIVVAETTPDESLPVPLVSVSSCQTALAKLSQAFYRYPSRNMLMIGVTGTCGKTTTSYLIERILSQAGYTVGVIGSITWRYCGTNIKAKNTTPSSDILQKLLSEMRAAGCTAVVMEVSSHALQLERTAGIPFDGMVFTNLSSEHLDFHKDMDHYFTAKSMLFTEYAEVSCRSGKTPVAAINTEDTYGRKLLTVLSHENYRAVVTYGFAEGIINAKNLAIGAAGIFGNVDDVQVSSPLIGHFNAENVLAAIALTKALGVPATSISKGIESVKSVPGRLERITNPLGIHVFIDHAHKVAALESVLTALRQVKGNGRVAIAFGCGGDRDRLKRPLMGAVACSLADLIWITSDNPRTEDPMEIIDEIKKGLTRSTGVCIILDRREAISHAISKLNVGDILVIAGRGDETHQIVGVPGNPGVTQLIPFDDREVVLECLKRRASSQIA